MGAVDKTMIEQEVKKALGALTSDAYNNGGALYPEQADEFLKLIRDNSASLSEVRHVKMVREQQQVDKMYIGEVVSELATENEDAYTAQAFRPAFGKVTLSVAENKIRSYWPITTESMQVSIEQGAKLEDTIIESAAVKVGSDLELLFWQGDRTLRGGAVTPQEKLLQVLTGMTTLTNDGHFADAEGANIATEIFTIAVRSMPDHIINMNPNLKWFMSRKLFWDYVTYLSGRATARVGDDALEAKTVRPFGIPIFSKNINGEMRYGVPSIPSNQDLPVAVATGAVVAGFRAGPFEISATANSIKMQIDHSGVDAGNIDFSYTFPTNGTYVVPEIANLLNAAMFTYITNDVATPATWNPNDYRDVFLDDGFGHLIIQSKKTGSVLSEVSILAPIATTAWDLLGHTVADTAGVDAGTGTVPQGTYLLLTPPENMMWGFYTGPAGGDPDKGVRVYSKFEPRFDRLELYIYTQVDAKIENNDAVVKVGNIRLLQL